MEITFKIVKKEDINVSILYNFLRLVDNEFPISLSKKVELCEYAKKIYDKAEIIMALREGHIVGMIAGYVNDIINYIAYVTILVVLHECRGQKVGARLVDGFIELSKNKNMKVINLYTHNTNKAAISLYERKGFKAIGMRGTEDIHFIKYLTEERR